MRIRLGWRQEDVATRARVSRAAVSRIERGLLEGVAFGMLVRVADALDVRLEVVAHWHGGDLDRLQSAGHSALAERVAGLLECLPGWVFAPEVSFFVGGERGWIDILAWHAPTRSLLVIELKTELVDAGETLGTLDRKRRLASRVAAQRGWHPLSVSVWLVIVGDSTNRRRVAAHRRLLRAALPEDGFRIRSWLRRPTGSISAMSFWSDDHVASVRRRLPTVKRVRPRARSRSVHAGEVPAGVGMV